MNENKKGLRITSGILLIVLAALRLTLTLPSFFALQKIEGTVLAIDSGYWIGFGQSILTIFIGIMLLVRGFRAASIAVIVYAVSMIAVDLGSIDVFFCYTSIPITSFHTVLLLCTVVLVLSLTVVGLFLQDRRSSWLLIISALFVPIIPFLETASAAAQMKYLGTWYWQGEGLAFRLLFSILKAVPTAAAECLLGIYFGAQTRKRVKDG